MIIFINVISSLHMMHIKYTTNMFDMKRQTKKISLGTDLENKIHGQNLMKNM